MTLSNICELVEINSIIIERDERQRRKIEVDDLQASIAARGLLQPIIIERATLRLVAGERRLTSCKNLGHTEILCRWAESLSNIERQLIELEENIKRQDLEWQEIVGTVYKVHKLHREIDPDWDNGETAEVCGIARGIRYRSISALPIEMQEMPRLVGCGDVQRSPQYHDAQIAAQAGNDLRATAGRAVFGNGTGNG